VRSAQRASSTSTARPLHACEPETFFSHRRDAGRTGRQGVIAYVSG
jgi:copper oxidase (laccase) domain-containing protein